MKKNNQIIVSVLVLAGLVLAVLWGGGFLSLLNTNSINIDNSQAYECDRGILDVGRTNFSDSENLDYVNVSTICRTSEPGFTGYTYLRNQVTGDYDLVSTNTVPFTSRYTYPRPPDPTKSFVTSDAYDRFGFIDVGFCYLKAVPGGQCGINLEPVYFEVEEEVPPVEDDEEVPPVDDEVPPVDDTTTTTGFWSGLTGWVTFDYADEPVNAGATTGVIVLILVLGIVFLPLGKRGGKK